MKKIVYFLLILLLFPTIVFAGGNSDDNAEKTCGSWSSQGESTCVTKSYQGYKCEWDGTKKGGSRCFKSNNLTEEVKSEIKSCKEIKESQTCQSSKVNGNECIWRQGACYAATDDGTDDTIIADDQTDRDNIEEQKKEEEKQHVLPEISLGKVTCEDIFKDGNDYNSTHKLLASTLRFMQYLGIILATVLSVVDFMKVVPTNDKDALNKAAKKAVTRLVIAIVIFFVPVILNFILGLVGFNNPTCSLL